MFPLGTALVNSHKNTLRFSVKFCRGLHLGLLLTLEVNGVCPKEMVVDLSRLVDLPVVGLTDVVDKGLSFTNFTYFR